jgi:hypothetical protein
MIPENLLTKPHDCLEVCLRPGAYGPVGRADLIRDVMGLANLPGTEPRHIVLGAIRGADGGIETTGLDAAALAEIEGYADLVTQYLEPELVIEINCSSVKGKLIAVLEINRCENRPYMVCTDLSQDIKSGACWIREPGLFRAARRGDLDRMFATRGSEPPAAIPETPRVEIGFGDDASALQIAMRLPELNTAPSVLAAKRLQDQISVVREAGERNVADSSVARLVHAQQYGSDLPYDERGVNTLVENFNAVDVQYGAADEYYYNESNALKLNFCIRNPGDQVLEAVTVVMTLPVVDEFKVVESLCAVPGSGLSQHENDLLGYPEVSYYQGAAQVRQDIDVLQPGAQQPLFESALRIALRPVIAGKKIAVRYALHARGLTEPQEGVLKLVLKQ